MTKRFCDRCGKEIVEFPEQNAEFPCYQILRIEAVMHIEYVHLCPKCIRKFTKWLEGKHEH